MSYITTSCSEPVSLRTTSMASLQILQPALKTSILCFTYLFPLCIPLVETRPCRNAGRTDGLIDRTTRPTVPDRCSDQQPYACVDRWRRIEIKLVGQNHRRGD